MRELTGVGEDDFGFAFVGRDFVSEGFRVYKHPCFS